MPLHVIKGTPPPATPAEDVRERVRKQAKPPSMISCRRCGGREVLLVKMGMLFKDGKPRGGTTQYLCAGCHCRGERVVLA